MYDGLGLLAWKMGAKATFLLDSRILSLPQGFVFLLPAWAQVGSAPVPTAPVLAGTGCMYVHPKLPPKAQFLP